MPTQDPDATDPIRYTHVPTQIEAMQWLPTTRPFVLRWMDTAGAVYWADATGQVLRIMTPQGARLLSYEDWVIRGVVGEWYPIKNTVFQQAYVESATGFLAAHVSGSVGD